MVVWVAGRSSFDGRRAVNCGGGGIMVHYPIPSSGSFGLWALPMALAGSLGAEVGVVV